MALLKSQASTAEAAESKYYHYPDIAHSDVIGDDTRTWLRACWTDIDKVKEMLRDGADVSACNANGFTGLHMAAWKFRKDIAQVLIEAGAEVNAEEANGLTPLDYCIDSVMQAESGTTTTKHHSKPYSAIVDYLEGQGAYRKEERAWLDAANQLKYAPNKA
mmetsp:Transcript_7499/g.16868  ORF Transcript_7499/g.16868 Transcript_7499/m.16868 type:complete len:161 (-) Transcript_7499:46-528(-)